MNSNPDSQEQPATFKANIKNKFTSIFPIFKSNEPNQIPNPIFQETNQMIF